MRKFSKYLLTISASLILAFSVSAAASAEDVAVQATQSWGLVEVSSALNVRAGHSTESDIIGQLSNRDIIKILDINTIYGWYKVDYSGTVGYTSSQYVTPITEQQKAEFETIAPSKSVAIIETAKSYIGTPYVYGGRSPKGFDCSGFTGYVFEKNGLNISRTSSSQATEGTKVSKSDLLAGDLVFFATDGGGISHVGIYIGNGDFIHSPSKGKTVEIESINSSYYSRTYVCARRAID